MASFVVLTPPDGGELDENAAFIRDGFSLPALFFHVIWLLWHRLWFAASLILLILVGLIAAVEAFPQWFLLIAVSWMVLNWFVALEGNAMRIAKKEHHGWQMQSVVEAQNAETAEEIYYAGHQRREADVTPPIPFGRGEKTSGHKPANLPSSGSDPALGLLGFHGRH